MSISNYPHQNKFLDNKYTKWYFNIIENAKSQNRKKFEKNDPEYVYYENHHILPKSLYIEYKCFKKNFWNSVLLTEKEHFICHWLLTKCFVNKNDNIKMNFCLIKMARCQSHIIISKNIQRKTMTGRKHTEETKKKLSEIKLKNNPFKGKKHSEETRKKISEKVKLNKPNRDFMKNEKWLENNRKRFKGKKIEEILGSEKAKTYKENKSKNNKDSGNPMYGKKHSEEAKKKISEKRKERKNIKSIYQCWLDKYGKEIADQKEMERKLKVSISLKERNKIANQKS